MSRTPRDAPSLGRAPLAGTPVAPLALAGPSRQARRRAGPQRRAR